MKRRNNWLVVEQLDKKLQLFPGADANIVPTDGWIKAIRSMLHMSLRQLGNRLGVTPQSVKDIEKREKQGSITINALSEAARAINMRLVYYMVPNDGSFEKMIERRAYEMAARIVNRTSTSMKLEDQENSEDRIKQSITELAEELKREMPKQLWD